MVTSLFHAFVYPYAEDLVGTWKGTCQQFAASNVDGNGTVCAPYSAPAVKFSYTVTYSANGTVSRSFGHFINRTYTNPKYNHSLHYSYSANAEEYGSQVVVSTPQYKDFTSSCVRFLTNTENNETATEALIMIINGTYTEIKVQVRDKNILK